MKKILLYLIVIAFASSCSYLNNSPQKLSSDERYKSCHSNDKLSGFKYEKLSKNQIASTEMKTKLLIQSLCEILVEKKTDTKKVSSTNESEVASALQAFSEDLFGKVELITNLVEEKSEKSNLKITSSQTVMRFENQIINLETFTKIQGTKTIYEENITPNINEEWYQKIILEIKNNGWNVDINEDEEGYSVCISMKNKEKTIID